MFSSIFPSELKMADITRIYKNKSEFDIGSYHPVIILVVLSKRCMFDQMNSYFNQILTKHQCVFRQGHSTQYLLILGKLEKSLDNSAGGGMLPTDLSKALDRLRHDLLIAKLAAYGSDQPLLCFA